MNVIFHLLGCLVFLNLICPGACKVIGAAVIPHGDFALDPSLVHFKNGSKEIHDASEKLGQSISNLKPDIIVLITPHGLEDSNSFMMYANPLGAGFALIGQDLHNASFPCYKVPLTTHLAPNLTQSLTSSLGAGGANLNVSSLLGFAGGEPIPLRWGEVIPLYFLRHYLATNKSRQLIISVPSRRYTSSVAMIPELLHLGGELFHHFNNLDDSVYLINSCDLAHTHLASGPYGFSPAAEPFDRACGRWVETRNSSFLLDTAAGLVEKALSCGFPGLVILQGLMNASPLGWTSNLFSIAHPTYYGMLVAAFQPQ
eukprot:m.172375 g.172375  ORF g.172375 m.172375 type:complete len:313 (+) comp25212_c1_seq2:230-1168(+)